jgi:hypothetical protein
MTPDRIAELRALAAAATPGPWYSVNADPWGGEETQSKIKYTWENKFGFSEPALKDCPTLSNQATSQLAARPSNQEMPASSPPLAPRYRTHSTKSNFSRGESRFLSS